MIDWGEFLLALAVFFLSHALPLRPVIRRPFEAAIGRRAFSLGYSLLSLAILVWLIGAAGRAPYVPLWYPAPWQAWTALALMLPACLLLTMGLASVNPLSFGGRAGQFDPAAPGIAGVARHPLLAAIALWSLAHLIANGTLAQALLFALFSAFAVLGMALIDRRRRREIGDAEWRRLARNTALFSLSGLHGLRATPPMRALAAGVVLYGALIVMHPLVIGITPLP